MNRLALGAAIAAVVAGPVSAGAYRIVLSPPANGKLLVGHGGVEAADDRTDVALVRLISPGNDIHDMGTVRVLVMNLGATPFEFGPEEVTLTLADGTVLKPVPVDKFENGRELVERETQHATANDLSNRNDLSGLASQTGGGPTVQSMSPGAASPGATMSGTEGQDRRTDEAALPGSQLLDSIYQLLVPLSVEPHKAWGGYYVFQMPQAEFAKHADQPLTILVRTGAQEHRFAATLKWK